MNLKKTLFRQVFNTIGLLLLLIASGLYLDSTFILKHYKDTQWLANIINFLVLSFLYYRANSRTREQIIYAVIIAIAGEYFFSLLLGMYTYRLGNIPHYIPTGHAIVYLGVYYFVRQSEVITNRGKIEIALYLINGVFATSFLLFKNDVLGFVFTLLTFYFVTKHKRERLFYLTMYFVIACLELIGTSYGCWWWPSTWFGKFDWMPSANPPIGISFFYFGLDLGCLFFYKLRHKEAWARMKNIRRIKHEKQLA